MTSHLLKLAVLAAALGLSAWTTSRAGGEPPRQDTCVCKCKWARDVGPMLDGTYTFAARTQTCPTFVVGNDVPCRDDKDIMHVSGGITDCRYVPAGSPSTPLGALP